jgi:arylsulfatase A-like enzyme
VKQLTLDVRRDIDAEFLARSKAFMKLSVEARKPFFLYFNHSLMHLPTIPRHEFKGKSGQGDWADCLLELDADFGSILDTAAELGISENTIIVFSGENGPEELEPWRGHPGFFDGSYFTGMEGSLRTPCLIRYPGRVPAGRQSNDIIHITAMFTTLLLWVGADIPNDRVIDGRDQRAFFEGKQEKSAREGFPYWMGPILLSRATRSTSFQRDSEARLVWGVNDFDDAANIPYVFDLVRLATSVQLAPNSGAAGTDVSDAILKGYRQVARD